MSVRTREPQRSQGGLVSLDLVAQDGTRVRANASAPSFRREESLEAFREQAMLHRHAESDEEADLRAQRAREAKARAVQERIDDAIATVKQLQAEGLGGDKPGTSTTDPDARVMKMPDGGFRPAYNVQFATAGEPEGGPRTVVGVSPISGPTWARSRADGHRRGQADNACTREPV